MIAMNILALIASAIAIGISIKAWQKSRAIYGIERRVIRQVTGGKQDLVLDRLSAKLNKELSSGQYTVLALLERKADKDWELLLGRITKSGH